MPAETPDPDALALAHDLRVCLGQLRRRLREEASTGDFTPSQVAVLRRLEAEGPTTVTALARAEGVRPQSMGATVAVLEAAGHVVGRPDPSDGRQTVLALGPAMLKAFRAGRAAREDWLFRSIRSNLNSKEQKTVATAVALLKRLLTDPTT